MECKKCEEMLAGYACGDLTAQEAEAIEAHLSGCAACRAASAAYGVVISSVVDEPVLSPSESESATVSAALAHAYVYPRASRQARTRSLKELLGFGLVTVAVFAFIATVLGLQAFGHIDVIWMIGSINPLRIALSAVVVVFVTSFIPIWVTARRRPLNGLTFGR